MLLWHVEARSFHSVILLFVWVEWLPWASIKAEALSSVSDIRPQIMNLPVNMIFVYCDRKKAFSGNVIGVNID